MCLKVSFAKFPGPLKLIEKKFKKLTGLKLMTINQYILADTEIKQIYLLETLNNIDKLRIA